MWRAAVNQHIAVAIRKQRLMHELAELKDKATRLEESNSALKVLLEHREADTEELDEPLVQPVFAALAYRTGGGQPDSPSGQKDIQ